LYDAITTCLEELERFPNEVKRLNIITDGADNFSSSEAKDRVAVATGIRNTIKHLQLHTLLFNVGGNLDEVKKAADSIGAEFKNLSSSNWMSQVQDYKNRFLSQEMLLVNAVKMDDNTFREIDLSNRSFPDVPLQDPQNSVQRGKQLAN